MARREAPGREKEQDTGASGAGDGRRAGAARGPRASGDHVVRDPRSPRPPPAPLPRRGPVVRWTAVAASVVSLGLLAWHMFLLGPDARTPQLLAWLDAALALGLGVEFLTRPGLRREGWRYVGWHLFDFVAIAPALLLAGQALPADGIAMWIILLARFARVLNRLVGDSFVENLAFVVVEAFEEELTDRIMLRMLGRIEADLREGSFGRVAAGALREQREPVLDRLREGHDQLGIAGQVLTLPGVEDAVRDAEGKAFDSATGMLASREVDDALRGVIEASFERLRGEIHEKGWKKRLRAQLRRV